MTDQSYADDDPDYAGDSVGPEIMINLTDPYAITPDEGDRGRA